MNVKKRESASLQELHGIRERLAREWQSMSDRQFEVYCAKETGKLLKKYKLNVQRVEPHALKRAA